MLLLFLLQLFTIFLVFRLEKKITPFILNDELEFLEKECSNSDTIL